MIDLFDYLADLWYFGIFLVLIAVNAAPLLMPPTWIILSSFYALDQSLDPVVLSAIGASGATIGRMILKKISGLFRKFVGNEQKANLEIIGNYLNRKKYGYVIASFLFAATPLPSNMLFVAYGLMGAKSIGLYAGFWFGRFLSYFLMISLSEVVLTPFLKIFEDRITGIIFADIIGVGVVILFSSINWALLITEKKFRFIRPRIWRL